MAHYGLYHIGRAGWVVVATPAEKGGEQSLIEIDRYQKRLTEQAR
jgi:hypothetical protein